MGNLEVGRFYLSFCYRWSLKDKIVILMFLNDVYLEVSVMLVGFLIWVDFNFYIIMKEIFEVMWVYGSEKESESYLRVIWYFFNFFCFFIEVKLWIGFFVFCECDYGNYSWFRYLMGVGVKLLIVNCIILNLYKCLEDRKSVV